MLISKGMNKHGTIAYAVIVLFFYCSAIALLFDISGLIISIDKLYQWNVNDF